MSAKPVALATFNAAGCMKTLAGARATSADQCAAISCFGRVIEKRAYHTPQTLLSAALSGPLLRPRLAA